MRSEFLACPSRVSADHASVNPRDGQENLTSATAHGTLDAADRHAARGAVTAAPVTNTGLSVTLPWPPHELSPNFRTRSRTLVPLRRKQYRKACAEAAWTLGVTPARGLRLDRIVFHPPTAARHDDDNLVARFKAGRDGLAQAMGVDDATFNGVPTAIGAIVKGGAVVALLTEIPG
ncbi:hypothetical protein [Sagittula sp. S175]|uniref:hypothetical protein n=1 Tax=Sagittula sp. S175 TaxID=3415129 RepID=UPI003C7DB963